jgi:hypothetical protein
VASLAGTAVTSSLSAAFASTALGLVSLLLAGAAFTFGFLLALKTPREYRRTCTEFKVLFADIAFPRLKRMYVLLLDILVAALPLMLGGWGLVQGMSRLLEGQGPHDPAPAFYLIPLDFLEVLGWKWEISEQMIVDLVLLMTGLFFTFLELFVWFGRRRGDLCGVEPEDLLGGELADALQGPRADRIA